MRNSFKIILVAAAAMCATACAEWLTPEPLALRTNTIETQNPELYAQYLDAIKAYKASDHRMTYVAFSNTAETPLNAQCRVASLPDSVDVVELTNPNYNDWTAEDMQEMREKFNTKFVMRISFPAIKEQMKAEFGDEYLTHIKDGVDALIKLAGEKNFDGITVEYEGQGTLHAVEDEIETLRNQEAQIFPSVSAWRSANPDKLLFFEGNPQHTVDHSVVLSADKVILPTSGEKSAQKCGYVALQAIQDEFKDIDVLFAVDAIPDDITDTSTGRYFDGAALFLLTRWLTSDAPDVCQDAGVAIYKVQNDCFSPSIHYPNVRAAIRTLNPNS